MYFYSGSKRPAVDVFKSFSRPYNFGSTPYKRLEIFKSLCLETGFSYRYDVFGKVVGFDRTTKNGMRKITIFEKPYFG